MKITKVKTNFGTWGKPISTDLSAIVERMRGESCREVVNRIATAAQISRMTTNSQEATSHLDGVDQLPRLVFGATFGKGGWDDIREKTYLLLTDIAINGNEQLVEEWRQRLAQIPYTVLVFRGSSRQTLKVVIRVGFADGHQPKDAEEYLQLLQTAQQSIAPVYQSLVGVTLRLQEVKLTSSCRMSQDNLLYYHPDAQSFPVIIKSNSSKDGTLMQKVDMQGNMSWYPSQEEMKRLQMEFYTCLQHAINEHCDEEAENKEEMLVTLADYCRRAGLEEEACVRRTLWQSEFKEEEDMVRKIFRSTYSRNYQGKKASQMNEKERVARGVRDFFDRRYQLRFNEVKQVVEFRANDQSYKPWQQMTDRDLRRMAFEEMLEGGNAWLNDMQLYLKSSMVRRYHPIRAFLDSVGEWDQKTDYIEMFARRLKTNYEHWPKYFHRWLLAMVAQALNEDRDYGNSMVPLLIGSQAMKKSSFCLNILPYSMREYYMGDIKMENAEQVERVLGRMWLVNIDEYDGKTEREQAKIKRLLTEKDVQIRAMRSDQYVMTPRLCSFIATTNEPTPLNDPTGSRRYLCVEVTGVTDMSGHINYQQMYAQAVWEIRHGACYWFTHEDEMEIMRHNQSFQVRTSLDDALNSIFEMAERSKEYFMTATDIQQVLRNRLMTADVPSLSSLGRTLHRQHFPDGSQGGVHGYYLKQRNPKV